MSIRGILAYDEDAEEAYVPNEEVRSARKRIISDVSWASGGRIWFPVLPLEAARTPRRISRRRILLAGISYDRNDPDKKHTCIIEEWEKG